MIATQDVFRRKPKSNELINQQFDTELSIAGPVIEVIHHEYTRIS